jgi:hypothetical protein
LLAATIIALGVIAAALFFSRRPVQSGAAVADKRIAVLPFVEMSQAKDQEFFSDGISEELLNLLAKVPQLQVAARTSLDRLAFERERLFRKSRGNCTSPLRFHFEEEPALISVMLASRAGRMLQ